MLNRGKFLLAVAILLMTQGCSSVFRGTTQEVKVETPQCPAAACTLANSKGSYAVNSTPQNVIVSKSFGDMTMTCQKAGNSQQSVHDSDVHFSTFGNIIIGGAIGLVIDGLTGAGYDYDPTLSNPLSCSGITEDGATKSFASAYTPPPSISNYSPYKSAMQQTSSTSEVSRHRRMPAPSLPRGLPTAYASASQTLSEQDRLLAVQYLRDRGIITD